MMTEELKCKNCGKHLDASDDYCRNCGAKVIRNRLTFKNLFEHISETFLNYDNKLLRTCTDLITKPEAVIVSYIEGVRKRYVNPISFFGLSLTLSGLSLFLVKKFYLQYFDLGAWMSSFDVFQNPGSQQILQSYSTNDSMEYSSFFFSLIIPVFGLMSALVFFDKKYNITEHIVLYAYTMSLYSMLAVVIGQIILLIVPENYIAFIFMTYPIMLLYHCFILKRMFKLSFLELFARTSMFLVLFFGTYFVIAIIGMVIGILTGNFSLKP